MIQLIYRSCFSPYSFIVSIRLNVHAFSLAMSNEDDDKKSGNSLRERGRNWSVDEYYCLLQTAEAIYNKTPESKRAFALTSEETRKLSS
jgi:hypothetical protein